MMADFTVKDSGERREFPTGSVRDKRDGKGRFDLIPNHSLFRLARLYEEGAKKYSERNWERGQNLMSYLDSCFRHLNNLLNGEQTEDHAACVAWNIFGFMHTLREIEEGRLPASLDDRPARMKPAKTVRTAEEVNKGVVPLKDGFVAFVETWKEGGCAWCNRTERGGGDYTHPYDCFQAIIKAPGLFEELKAACDAAGEKK
jgi:hypothetical protein